MVYYKGSCYIIHETEDAIGTRNVLESDINYVALVARIKRFADTGKLRSPDQMRHEGKSIFAIKHHSGLRAYGWYCQTTPGIFYISHYILKKTRKLDPADLKRATTNRSGK